MVDRDIVDVLKQVLTSHLMDFEEFYSAVLRHFKLA